MIHIARTLFAIQLLVSTTAFAWGERGHDLVTRVAVRILVQQDGSEMAFSAPFLAKEQMLGHVANVPDIVWRNLGREVEDLNAPTHYIDLEYLDPEPSLKSIPSTVKAAEKQVTTLCASSKVTTPAYVCPLKKDKGAASAEAIISTTGSAPWRVRQLFTLLRNTFAEIKTLQKQESKDVKTPVNIELVNKALLYAGILSHFIGDLAQPLHTTRDYNGWESGAGGLHSYFESQIVDALDLSLDYDVYKTALKEKPAQQLSHVFSKAERQLKMQDPFAIAVALSLDSFAQISSLKKLDRETAIISPSSLEANGLKIPARRQPAAQVMGKFRPFIVERLAAAADTLAYLWREAWQQGGKPDLSAYASYDYVTAPAFIAPDYLDQK